MAKQDNNMIWVGIILLIIVVFMTKGGDITNIFNQAPTDTLTGDAVGDCYIWFDDYNVEVGDDVTGTIQNGANAMCYLYWRIDDGGWVNYGKNPLYTDSTGKYTDTILASESGIYYFRAICGDAEGNVLCVTPLVSVIVSEDSGDGGDDGGDGSFCSDTDSPTTIVGLDYYNLNTYGVCTDASGSTPDVCPNGNGDIYICEAYCGDAVCMGVSTPCPDGRVCINGVCVLDQLPCEIIWNPTEQTCAEGLCDEGTCVFESATLVTPARCSCE